MIPALARGHYDAALFMTSYAAEPAQAAAKPRPLLFAFNGGPGSASIWLHMGALGPRTVVMDPQGFMPHPPFRVHDNPYTPLDKSDMVPEEREELQ